MALSTDSLGRSELSALDTRTALVCKGGFTVGQPGTTVAQCAKKTGPGKKLNVRGRVDPTANGRCVK
ncbi:MAG: hypothetical protein ACKOJF_23535 [Planctomycetaceae bacterium]